MGEEIKNALKGQCIVAQGKAEGVALGLMPQMNQPP